MSWAWPKLLVLVRHAESVGNIMTAEERAQDPRSTWEYPLTSLGRQQACNTGIYIRDTYKTFDLRYVSYYIRSKATMHIIYPDEAVREDARLAEAQRGIRHTLTEERIERDYPGENARREREGYYHYRPFGGENWPDVEQRIHSFLDTLRRDCAGKKVLIVGHGHWMILFQRLIHNLSIEEALDRYKNRGFKNASVTVLRSADGQNLTLEQENYAPWEGALV